MPDKKIAFIGDLHFYDGPARAHKDYFANCKACLDLYTAEFSESKPDYIFLSGDIVGLSERVMRTRVGLSVLIAYLQKWSELCHGNLYSIAGNHDYTKGSHLSDFDLLTQLGIIKTAKFVDVNALRIHLIDYGKELEPISLSPSQHNIALMHANLQIDGLTTWFHADEGIPLPSLKHLKGLEYILCGHIHNPSPRVVSCSIENENCCLLYLGNATRPKRKDTWSSVWVVYADCSDTGNVDLGKTKLLKLPDTSEIFLERILEEDTEETSVVENTPVVDIELLTQILDELSPAMMGSNIDYKEQVRRLAGVDKEAAEIAISYLDKADEDTASVAIQYNNTI